MESSLGGSLNCNDLPMEDLAIWNLEFAVLLSRICLWHDLLCYPIDVAIAIDHLTLCATAEGLGTCWIGAFDEGKVKEILDIPKEILAVELSPYLRMLF